jgi:hypothetical protein
MRRDEYHGIFNTTAREPLLKGKAQYSWPPCIYKFISAAFDTENFIYYFTKQVTLTRRATFTYRSPPPMFPERANFMYFKK